MSGFSLAHQNLFHQNQDLFIATFSDTLINLYLKRLYEEQEECCLLRMSQEDLFKKDVGQLACADIAGTVHASPITAPASLWQAFFRDTRRFAQTNPTATFQRAKGCLPIYSHCYS
jgi:hypothetical protein